MRKLALASALALTVACGSASSVESMAIFQDLAAKGLQAGQEADELIRKDQGSLAVIVMNRHLREVDAAIEKATNDPAIRDDHKAMLIKELRQHESEVTRSRNQLQALVEWQEQVKR